MNDAFLLAAITCIPAVISVVVAYVCAHYFGKAAFRKRGQMVESYLYALSVFLITEFLMMYVVAFGLSIFSGGSDILFILFAVAGPYRIYVNWGLKILALIMLWFSVKKVASRTAAFQNQTPVPTTARGKLLPFLLIGALFTVAYPIYSIFHSFQLQAEWNAHEVDIVNQISDTVDRNADQIRSAIEKYKDKNGTYPLTLSELIPEYMPRMPVDPRARQTEYTVNSTRSDYRLCVYVDTGKKCMVASSGSWSSVRSYCPGMEKPAGIDCQPGEAPEESTF